MREDVNLGERGNCLNVECGETVSKKRFDCGHRETNALTVKKEQIMARKSCATEKGIINGPA